MVPGISFSDLSRFACGKGQSAPFPRGSNAK
jgi:hypothetical protein